MGGGIGTGMEDEEEEVEVGIAMTDEGMGGGTMTVSGIEGMAGGRGTMTDGMRRGGPTARGGEAGVPGQIEGSGIAGIGTGGTELVGACKWILLDATS